MSNPVTRSLTWVVLAAALLVAQTASALTVVKSPNDRRSYEYFRLDNGLRALVISDPKTDKASAALDVNVGSSSDPANRPGLAHFLEHMLFLGTKKYPQPGAYKAYIDAHGGQDNAYTAFANTNFFFDVDKNFLEPALDRFAQFFVAPLFNPPYVERERQVVHSEYSSGRESDGRRVHSAFEAAIDPEHPLARFSVGTRETLADRPGHPVREDLLRFYRTHYSAGIMTLVVLGKEPTSVLRKWVREKFSDVPNTGAKPLAISAPIFAPGRLPARLDVVPIKEQRSLSLTFPIPEVETHWKSKPTEYIANLLGHEGPGSLLQDLKHRGWADALSAGLGFDQPSGATVNVSIALTRAGLAHVDDVIGLVFQDIRLIARDGVAPRYFDESRRIADLQFRYQEKSGPIGTTRALAAALHYYPPAEVLHAPYDFAHWNPGLVRDYLARLNPSNVLVTVVAPGLKADAKSAYYDAPYRLAAIDPALVARWRTATVDTALALPPPNPFIPEHLHLLAEKGATPVPVRIDAPAGIELWFQKDETFRVPRADFYLNMRSPVANDSPRHSVLTDLYIEMVNDQLDAFTYAAGLAGLSYSLYPHVRGFSVRIDGYSDNEDRLLRRIVADLAHPALDPGRFAVIKADLLRRLRNQRDDPAYRRAMAALQDILVDPDWSAAARARALEPVTRADLVAFVPKLLARVQPVALAHGNLDAKDAVAFARIVADGLLPGTKLVKVPRARVVMLQPGRPYVHEVENRQRDAAVVLYLQGGERDIPARARIALLAQIAQSPFFEDLRTQKRLGYIVYASYANMMEVPGLDFVVQSPTTPPGALEHDIRGFLDGFAERLKKLDTASLRRNRDALLSDIMQKDTQLSDRTDRYWDELDRGYTHFDLRKRLARAVRAIDRASLIEAWTKLYAPATRRELSLRARGRAPATAGEPAVPGPDLHLVSGIDTLKQSLPRFTD